MQEVTYKDGSKKNLVFFPHLGESEDEFQKRMDKLTKDEIAKSGKEAVTVVGTELPTRHENPAVNAYNFLQEQLRKAGWTHLPNNLWRKKDRTNVLWHDAVTQESLADARDLKVIVDQLEEYKKSPRK